MDKSPLSEVVALYIEERTSRKELSALSARNRRSALRIFAATIGDRPLAEITPDEVDFWLRGRAHLAPATRRAHWSALRSFFCWARTQGHMDHDPLAGFSSPRQPRSVPRALPPASVARLLAVCPDARGRAVVWLMVGLGLRCMEVSQVQLGDWDRERQVLTIRGKGAHERVLPVPRPVALALRAYLREHPQVAGPLVRSYRDPSSPLTADAISGMVSEWMRMAKVKRLPRDGVSAHALRHTAASDVLDTCGDLRVVQEMLGHSQLSTTSIYLRRAGLGKMRRAMAGRDYDGSPGGDAA